MGRFRLLLLFTLLGFSFNSGATQKSPKVIPDKWVADYDYESDMRSYLKAQYQSARDQGLTPYVYIYSDRYDHCRGLRVLMKRQIMRDALQGTYMVMLDHYELEKQYQLAPDPSLSIKPLDITPVILPISKQGTLKADIFRPDLYLNHPEQIREAGFKGYTAARKWSGSLPMKVFAKRLRKYFSDTAFKY